MTVDEVVAPSAVRSKARSVGMYVVLVLAGLLLLLSAFAGWVNRVALNTGVFVDTSSELIEDPAIRRAVAERAVEELYVSVDVEAAIDDRLPDNVKSLAGPTAAGLRQAAPQILERALEQPALQRLWETTLRQTHEELVAVLQGGGTTVSTEGGVVTLDLRELVLETAGRIGIRKQVEDRLPADAGRIEILRSDELDTAQDGVQVLETLAWALPLLTLLGFGGALWVAPGRRRALRDIGITIFVVGVLGLAAANLTGDYVVGSLVDERDVRPAAGNAWDILTELLRSSFRWLIVVGALVVVAAWLAGPGRRAVSTRRALAPAVQERVWAYVVLSAVTVLLLLWGVASDFARLLALFVLVALTIVWIEVVRAQTLREFPDARGSFRFDEARDRISSWLGSRWDSRPVAGPGRTEDLTARLASLAELHTRGELTDDEYSAAKKRVLADE